MTDLTVDSIEKEALSVLKPLSAPQLLDGANLLSADAAGYCSDGVCSFPAQKAQ